MTGTDEFDDFYGSRFEHVFAVVRSQVPDAEDARDFTQEAFVRCYLRWERICRYDSPEAWVIGVALRLSISHWRRARVHARVSRLLARRSANAVDEARSEAALGIDAALERLPPRRRAVAVLFYLQDLPVAEIARRLELSEGTVKTHLSRARNDLRLALEIENEDVSGRR